MAKERFFCFFQRSTDERFRVYCSRSERRISWSHPTLSGCLISLAAHHDRMLFKTTRKQITSSLLVSKNRPAFYSETACSLSIFDGRFLQPNELFPCYPTRQCWINVVDFYWKFKEKLGSRYSKRVATNQSFPFQWLVHMGTNYPNGTTRLTKDISSISFLSFTYKLLRIAILSTSGRRPFNSAITVKQKITCPN